MCRRLIGVVAGVDVTTKELADERTHGGPVAVRIGNSEWPKWSTVTAADPVDPELIAGRARSAPLTRPRPGHADLAGMTKFGFDDARPVLERASARETAARVVLGTVVKAFLRQVADVEIVAAGVVAEAVVALVLADAVLEEFDSDSLGETRRNLRAYRG